jgi:hypothetical protein
MGCPTDLRLKEIRVALQFRHGRILAFGVSSGYVRDPHMTYICLWSPDWKSKPLERMAAAALKIVPRVAVDSGKGIIWADGKSLEITVISQDLEKVISE